MKNKLPQEYLDILSRHGRDLKPAGVNGVALPKRSALDAIDVLRRAANIPVLGGDVFRIVDEKISLSYDNWDCKSNGESTTEKYLNDSLSQAEAYIRAYRDPEDSTILYQLVLGDLFVRTSP